MQDESRVVHSNGYVAHKRVELTKPEDAVSKITRSGCRGVPTPMSTTKCCRSSVGNASRRACMTLLVWESVVGT